MPTAKHSSGLRAVKAPCIQPCGQHSAFGGIEAFVSPQREVKSTPSIHQTYQVCHLNVLNSFTAWSPPGRLAQCQRLKGYVPGVVAEDVEIHGQALEQEQLLMEEEKGSLLRGRLRTRRQTADPPIISNHLPIRISTTTNHGGARLPYPRHSRATQVKRRVHRARVGATQLWKIAGPTSSA